MNCGLQKHKYRKLRIFRWMASLMKQLSSKFKSTRTTKIQYSKQSNLPPGTITDFIWKDYSTTLFRSIQELGDVIYDEYLLSICNHETLTELAMRGCCGRPFYVRPDNRFVIKILRKSEAKVLVEMLPRYFRHLEKYNNSLLAKIYGLHASRPGNGGQKVYFVVMDNLIQTELQIHRQYDLKGSSQGRHPTKAGTQARLTLKDFEFDLSFYVDASTRSQLLEQIKIDCKFLEEQGIMDYSLLLGVHMEHPLRGSRKEKSCQKSVQVEPFNESPCDDPLPKRNGSDPFHVSRLDARLCRDLTFSDFCGNANSYRDGLRLGAKVPAQAIKIVQNVKEGSTANRRPKTSERSSVLLYIGIIDFLQNYNMIKRLEHAYKSLQYDAKEINSVNPKLYSTRFQEFLSKVFISDDLRHESPPMSLIPTSAVM